MSIKQYHHVHIEQEQISFDIKRMEVLYEKFKGQPDEPHRHDYYTVILVEQGSGKHLIDFHSFDLGSYQVYFISPGQVHQLLETQKSYGCVLTFSPQFMLENGIETCFIEDLHLFQDFGYTPPLTFEVAEWNRLMALTQQVFEFYNSDKKFKYQAVGALLKLLLIQCNNACSLSQEENTQSIQASLSLLRNFKTQLNEQYQQWHKVSEYASVLHITPDYLNTAVKALTGKSAKEHIQSRIIIAAKRLLKFSDLPTKAIAYQLGFSEPANFSQFFKKCVGVSPTKFRNAKI